MLLYTDQCTVYHVASVLYTQRPMGVSLLCVVESGALCCFFAWSACLCVLFRLLPRKCSYRSVTSLNVTLEGRTHTHTVKSKPFTDRLRGETSGQSVNKDSPGGLLPHQCVFAKLTPLFLLTACVVYSYHGNTAWHDMFKQGEWNLQYFPLLCPVIEGERF